MDNKRTLAIIGVGPRGGYALENFIKELVKKDDFSPVHILLFEETGNWGNGQVYDTKQNQTNWININERILHLNKRPEISFAGVKIPKFPSYHEWRNKDFDKVSKEDADTYPPRATVGEYLEQRFQTFVKPLLKKEIISLHEERVEKVTIKEHNKIKLKTEANIYENVDEILLTIGHQPTELSEQIVEWEKFVADKKNFSLFKSPYPISAYLNSDNLTAKSRIGIRGFGLAMIDVVRGIADKFGDFITEDEFTKSCRYETSHDIKNMFIPFSLNGLPPAPKPLNANIDKTFEPESAQIAAFEAKIGDVSTQKKAESTQFLIDAFVPIATKVYLGLSDTHHKGSFAAQEIEKTVKEWLKDDKYEHPTITPVSQSAEKIMQDFVEMATGTGTVSLDYCIGQVWRYCQPSIYKELSYNECSEEVFAEIIGLDEGTKRYSYGPPVESIQQMLSLIEADIMTFDMVRNPDFELTDDGWKMTVGKQSITADMMIDSVLDSPKIEAVNSPIVKSMLLDDLIEPVHDKLGISTDENGYVISRNKKYNVPIALSGRLAKGTVIGVDAILECFGSRPQQWASKAVQRHCEAVKS